jgi:uncharacterized membrane protein YidH (DUF202 family)
MAVSRHKPWPTAALDRIGSVASCVATWLAVVGELFVCIGGAGLRTGIAAPSDASNSVDRSAALPAAIAVVVVVVVVAVVAEVFVVGSGV